MKSMKYKDDLYVHRPIKDLKEMVNTSAEIYGDRNAFLVKTKCRSS